MDPVAKNASAVEVPRDASLVYFFRGEDVFGGTHMAVVLDDRDYVGTLEQGHHVAYLAEPGRHRFVVVSEAADFLDADLTPGKVYCVTVRSRFGMVRDRFSLVANNDAESIDRCMSAVSDTPRVTPNEHGRRWYAAHRASFDRKQSLYYPIWVRNPRRAVLDPASGRDVPPQQGAR